MHVTISVKGRSKLFFVPANNAVNAEVYCQIIRANVIPFIQQHHSNVSYYFWPDLASAHYSRSALELLQSNNIWFIPKEANPPAVASLRPIEDFWSALKKRVYDEGWEAETFDQLKERIRRKAREIPMETIVKLFRTVKERKRA